MTGFNPDRATRQMFVDWIVNALSRPGGMAGDDYGWHLTEVMQGDPGETLITFETPRALWGWDGESQEIEGPHQVTISVKTIAPQAKDATETTGITVDQVTHTKVGETEGTQVLWTSPGPLDLLCRRCDVFVGFGAVGVAKQPAGRDQAWLVDHCWLCGRSRDEIIDAGR